MRKILMLGAVLYSAALLMTWTLFRAAAEYSSAGDDDSSGDEVAVCPLCSAMTVLVDAELVAFCPSCLASFDVVPL